MRTKARVRFKKQERIQRQASERIVHTMSGDQRRVMELSVAGYQPGEIARELALSQEYVVHFMTGLVQRLTHDNLIPSPDWRNVLRWAAEEEIISPEESQP